MNRFDTDRTRAEAEAVEVCECFDAKLTDVMRLVEEAQFEMQKLIAKLREGK
jgi:hypothetical protein